LSVCSVTKSRMAKLRTQMPICRKMPDNNIDFLSCLRTHCKREARSSTRKI
jgi:hypothetical protein